MAFTPPTSWDYNPYAEFNFKCKEVTFGGKLVTGTIRVPDHKMITVYSNNEFKEWIKSMMAQQLAEYMISNGLVEFTQMKDSITLDTIVKARCYLTPSDQVRILRIHYNETT